MPIRHNITLDRDISRELESIAAELGEKKSTIIEKALAAYFDLLDLELVRRRIKDVEEGRDEITDAETVWQKLGI